MMQERIVMWGTTGATHKNVLIAIALKLESRLVDIWMFDKDHLPEGFASDMIKKWEAGEEVAFPEKFEHREQPLNDQSLLPEDIRVDQPERIRKVQNEWAYQILAQKTYESFLTEMKALDEKVDAAEDYVSELWDTAKNIWDRVLRLRNDNMMRKQYAEEIKEKINLIFDKIKLKRDNNSRQMETISSQNLKEFQDELGTMNKHIEEGNQLQDIFNQLKQFQEKVKNSKLIQSHRKDLWVAIDNAFEALKSKRGESRNKFTDSRIDGLKQVVIKMEKGLMRDKQDLNFQHKRQDDNKSSQLEVQLRKAKIQVLEDTIKSKEEKLSDIYKTISELENKKSKFKPKEKPAEKEVKAAAPHEAVQTEVAAAAPVAGEEVLATAEEIVSPEVIETTASVENTEIAQGEISSNATEAETTEEKESDSTPEVS